MNDPMDTTYWSGDDEKFGVMVEATERSSDFTMNRWGDKSCGTACCMWGNYVFATGLATHRLSNDPNIVCVGLKNAAQHLGISLPEFRWLFFLEHLRPEGWIPIGDKATMLVQIQPEPLVRG